MFSEDIGKPLGSPTNNVRHLTITDLDDPKPAVYALRNVHRKESAANPFGAFTDNLNHSHTLQGVVLHTFRCMSDRINDKESSFRVGRKVFDPTNAMPAFDCTAKLSHFGQDRGYFLGFGNPRADRGLERFHVVLDKIFGPVERSQFGFQVTVEREYFGFGRQISEQRIPVGKMMSQ